MEAIILASLSLAKILMEKIPVLIENARQRREYSAERLAQWQSEWEAIRSKPWHRVDPDPQ